MVNRSKAQKVYREILHEARDPALLEQSQGQTAIRERARSRTAEARRKETEGSLLGMKARTTRRNRLPAPARRTKVLLDMKARTTRRSPGVLQSSEDDHLYLAYGD